MAVPKKKTAKSRSKTRHTSYQEIQRWKIEDWINPVKCDNCGSMKSNHTACAECGFYRWKQVLKTKKKSADDVTVVQA